jgi:hypothetical protein
MSAFAETIEGLRTAVRGGVITPADTGYDDARRVWNATINRRPAAIVRCRSAADVIAAVNFARDNRLPLAVRGGAHNVAGRCTCDDGIVIDFSEMKSIRVDPAAQTVRAEPGLRWAEFDRETQAFGLATTGGTVGDTGIAGLTLGGGFGWLGGRHGMTADNLIGADVVLANGTLVHASDRENPDLFWALRGGGGNFGVVTSFEYKVHPIGPMIVGGIIVHPFPQAADALRFYGEFIRQAPDDLTVAAVLMTAPDGQKACGLVAAYAGPVEEGLKAVEPLKAFGTPVVDMIGAVPYVAQQSLLEAAMPPNVRNYWKADFVPEMSAGVIEVAVTGARRESPPTQRRIRTGAVSISAFTLCGPIRRRMASTLRGCVRPGTPCSRTCRAGSTSTSWGRTKGTTGFKRRTRATTNVCARSRGSTIRITCSA